ncbi:MAG TPA: ACP S-malonyltransferase [Chitinophaga sp.]|uniref:ACP S-malonyltransferase n=1 Tax=Chitinophaga sp. TaxID=1869181 RepID=UPI002D1C2968|nr:ACP S-malonyltransferase [Chitinophaga sp.]HVI45851.1 ACP S-malonyltransferase [Chitinophaga sp.]
MKNVFMFSGQGSQYYNMGKDLFDHYTPFRKWMLKIDTIFKSVAGVSLLRHVYDPGRGYATPFIQINYSHPAIFAIQYALARALTEEGIYPDYLVGASLGEFVSATFSGVMSLEEGVRMVWDKAVLVADSLKEGEGGMMAVLHNNSLYHCEPALYENSELAAINYPQHFVIAGWKHHLALAEDYLKQHKIAYQYIPVAYAFHSSQLDAIEARSKKYLDVKRWKQPGMPMVSCLDGNIQGIVPPYYFWDVVRSPILFNKAIHTLEKQEEDGLVYIDIGPSGTMAGFTKQNLAKNSRSVAYPLITPFNRGAYNLDLIRRHKPSNNPHMAGRNGTKKKAYIFPGQGSQVKGMGEHLFDRFPELTAIADRVLGYSIKELCLENSRRLLNRTDYTQPALFVVNALSYLKLKEETGYVPDYFAGHSLGEYNALFAAGAFDLETGVRLVQRRGMLMAAESGGGMAAILGLAAADITKFLALNNLSTIDVANFNVPTQTVISGKTTDIDHARKLFLEQYKGQDQVSFVPLNVSAAFHSRYMREAQHTFTDFLQTFRFAALQAPVVSNATAALYKDEEIHQLLTKQLSSPVMWLDSMQYLRALGVEEFVEVGPGNVLTKMQTRIQQHAIPDYILERVVKNVDIVDPATTTITTDNVTPVVDGRSLGSEVFRKEHGVQYAYVAGSMHGGISSETLVCRMAAAGFLSFYGTSGLTLQKVESAIQQIQSTLESGQPYGMNLTPSFSFPALEERLVDLYLRYGVHHVEAGGYVHLTPALVRYRAKGLSEDSNGKILIRNCILAKAGSIETARLFLQPPPTRMLQSLQEQGVITAVEAALAARLPVADDICLEVDTAWRNDKGLSYASLPFVLQERQHYARQYGYTKTVCIGIAGGIGTPAMAASMFLLGADFILTGSINQCTQEAQVSDYIKKILAAAEPQDTGYAPAEDMFELGAKVQVLKKGFFFPARASKLYDLYRRHNAIEEIDRSTQEQLQQEYLKKSFSAIYSDIRNTYSDADMPALARAESNPKEKMALIFKWYLRECQEFPIRGLEERKVDYQVYSSAAMGAFNQWVKGTELENWSNRRVAVIGKELMDAAVVFLQERLHSLFPHK